LARKHANLFQWAHLLTNMALGVALRISFFSAGAVLRAFGGQSHVVNGVVDGFAGRGGAPALPGTRARSTTWAASSDAAQSRVGEKSV
jgi:hypothetical protein